MLRALLAAVALAAGPSGPTAPGQEVERVVAVVRGRASGAPQVLTLTRLEAETRVALVARGALLAAEEPLDGAALRAGLEALVDELLLVDEAARLQVFEVDATEREAELAHFAARFASPAAYRAFLRRCGLVEEEIAAALARTLRARRYVESRVARAGQLSDADVTAWLDQHAAALGTRDREAARAEAARERMAQEARTLLREVRARGEVRFLGELPGNGLASGPAVPAAAVPAATPRQARR
jgi:hypothetical protein